MRTVIRLILASILSVVLSGVGRADVPVYVQAPNAGGGQYKSAWYAPDGLDGDEYVWDAFTLASSTAITQVQWRGAYTNYLSGAGLAPVYNFTVAIYGSIGGGSQPDIVAGALRRYTVGGNAGETPAGQAGGVNMYDYHFTLPSPFQAAAGVKYWVQIEAWQGVTPVYGWPPDWSIARGTGGEGTHFRRVTGGGYATIAGDGAFTLLASSLPTFTITATVSPAGAGAVTGAGAYPAGSTATLEAIPNAGWAFARWTENGSTVSQNARYSFTVTADRSLTAGFIPAYTVTTSSWPVYGGTTAGGGVYAQGAPVTVTATPAHGFVFSGWSENGVVVSTATPYTFSAAGPRALLANFAHAPDAATFTFDDAPRYTPLPITLTAGGVTATFSGTGQSYSVQQVGELGIAPAGFSGNMLFPGSVFLADLVIDFDRPVVDFSVLFAPHELGCDSSALMRATGYRNGVVVGTNTARAPVPGTWPSGTLTLAVPGGFDRVVVHYDAAPPPPCQDYGVIFVADNVTVVAPCEGPAVTGQPASVAGCASGASGFSVAATGSGVAYQWQVLDGGVWGDLSDGDIALADGRTFGVAGAWAGTLTVGPASGRAVVGLASAEFRCLVSGACGPAVASAPAVLTVCAADFNCDAFVDFFDYDAFVGAFEAGDPTADVNADGFLDFFDYDAFVGGFESGC